MKKTLLSISLFLVFTYGYSQNTTQEEFNFMQIGYKTMKESGLDMKKGYSLTDTMRFLTSSGKYKITYYSMIRDKDKSLSGTIAEVKSRSTSDMYYLGIVAANNDGSIDLENTLMATIKNYGWDTNTKNGFMQSLAEYMSVTLTKRYMTKTKTTR